MTEESDSKPSFSPYRKWIIAFNVGLIVALVFAVVVMANYLSRDYFVRVHLSTQSNVHLFPRTVKFLHTITNSVKITLYYDKEDPFYSTIAELLNEYHAVNPRISLRIVDYRRDPAPLNCSGRITVFSDWLMPRTWSSLMAGTSAGKSSMGMPWFSMCKSRP